MLMPSLRMVFKHRLQLALGHGEVAVDDGILVAARQKPPRC